jgi:hypothetical protein
MTSLPWRDMPALSLRSEPKCNTPADLIIGIVIRGDRSNFLGMLLKGRSIRVSTLVVSIQGCGHGKERLCGVYSLL